MRNLEAREWVPVVVEMSEILVHFLTIFDFM